MPVTTAIDERAAAQERSIRSLSGPDSQHRGPDGSRTPPQVTTTVSTVDGELPRPVGAGEAAYRKARQMRRDPTIRMVRELAMAPILMAEWEYERLSGAPDGARELIEDVLGPMRLRLVHTSLCGMLDYGWQPYEILGDPWDDGTSAMRLKPLLQDLTNILVREADGSYYGLRQQPVPGSSRTGWVYLVDDESAVISQGVEGTNWYGESTMRSLEAPYDEGEVVMRASRKYEAKVAGTHWVVYYPLGVSMYGGVETDNGEVARRLLQNAEAVGGICVPRSVQNTLDALNAAMANSEAAQWKIELLSDKGSGAVAYEAKLRYIDTLKVRAFGWPERAVLEGQFGTKAEAETHGDLAVSAMEARHALLCAQYNDKFTDRLLRWNYGPSAVGTVRVRPQPLADRNRKLFEQVYMAVLGNPQGFVQESAALDLPQMRDRLGLPEIKVQPGLTGDPMVDAIIGGQQPAVPLLEGPAQQPQGPVALGLSAAADRLEAAAAETRRPTEAQAKAGNYRKGKLRVHGMTVTVETPKGKRRKPEWPKLPAHYGYINRTEGKDGDHVDCFVGKHPDCEYAVVIDQLDKRGRFDEHKVMLGYKSKAKAIAAYKAAYDDGRRVGPTTVMTMAQFRKWLRDGDTTRPASGLKLAWDESKHPRDPGGEGGGQFVKIKTLGQYFGGGHEQVREAELRGEPNTDIDSELDKLPKFNGVAYRGIALTDSELQQLKTDIAKGRYKLKTTQSASKDDTIARGFTYNDDDATKSNRVLFQVRTQTAADFSKQNKPEQEVILRRGTKYKWVDHYVAPDGTTIITMTETK